MLKIFSFFSGSGFLDLGFESSGFEIQLVNEINPSFLEAYIYSRKNMNIPLPVFGQDNFSIENYFIDKNKRLAVLMNEAKKDGSLVGFIGGPPCPDFSIAGKQKGKEGEQGRLSELYIDLIITYHPDFFFFENVKGLYKTKKHRLFFEELKKKLIENGYYLTENLVNALEYGVPQDRDRILLFGIHNCILKNPEINPLLDFNWNKHKKYSIDKIKELSWPNKTAFNLDSKLPIPAHIPLDLTVQYWFEKNDVENHPNSRDFFQPRSGKKKMEIIEEGDVSKKSYKRLHRWRYSPTVAYGNNEVHLHPYKIRRLSASEAMSLQSLPKNFCLPATMSLTDKFKTIGNGVPFLLSKAVGTTIREFIGELNVKGKIHSERFSLGHIPITER